MGKSSDWDEIENARNSERFWASLGKYVIFLGCVYITAVVVVSSASPVGTALFLGVFWIGGVMLYRRRKGIKEWVTPEFQGRELVTAKKPETIVNSFGPMPENILDTAGVRPLTHHEVSAWESLVDDFNNEGYDPPASFNFKKKDKE